MAAVRSWRTHAPEVQIESLWVRQSGNKLAITMQAEDPPIIIHFLRNHAAWPAFWEFRSNTPADAPPDATLRFEWKNNDA